MLALDHAISLVLHRLSTASLVLLLVGIGAAWLVHRRTGSVFLSSTAFAVFFSYGIVMYRLGFPVPTLILIAMAVREAMKPAQPCVQSSNGCYEVEDEASTYILLPFLFQWGFWFLVFRLGHLLFSDKRKQQAP